MKKEDYEQRIKDLEAQVSELIGLNRSLNDEFQKTSKELGALRNSFYDKESKLHDLQEKFKYFISFSIARFKGVQMLFNVMKGGTTHRQKEAFVYQSIEAINVEIAKLIDEYNSVKHLLPSECDELPF